MSKPRRDKHYLADIVEAIERILSYTQGLTYADFLANAMVQDAMLRNLQVIGEATKKLSDALSAAHPDVPWREMAGMRDKIVHDYFGINYQVVWDVVQRDLPGVLLQIRAMLEAGLGGEEK